MQAQVAKYVSDELGLVNSYDTWHGKKMCGILHHFHTHFRNEECVKRNKESYTGPSS